MLLIPRTVNAIASATTCLEGTSFELRVKCERLTREQVSTFVDVVQHNM